MIDVKAVQLSKALSGIDVMPTGMTIERRPLLANALAPIEVSELGKLIVFKAVHCLKALAGILVQPAGIVTSPFASGGCIQAHTFGVLNTPEPVTVGGM